MVTAVPVLVGAGTSIESAAVALPHVGWDTYERLLADDEERQVPRLTYDRGVLELVSPSLLDERSGVTLTLLIEIVAAQLGIPTLNAGSTTFKRQDLARGFEPDGSFYIQHEGGAARPGRDRSRGRSTTRFDLGDGGLAERDRQARAFAAMGIPEVWRTDGLQVTILLLKGV